MNKSVLSRVTGIGLILISLLLLAGCQSEQVLPQKRRRRAPYPKKQPPPCALTGRPQVFQQWVYLDPTGRNGYGRQ